jgi:hypothetical protein
MYLINFEKYHFFWSITYFYIAISLSMLKLHTSKIKSWGRGDLENLEIEGFSNLEKKSKFRTLEIIQKLDIRKVG